MEKSKKLIVVGTSSNSRLARFYFEKDTEYSVEAFAVNGQYIKSDKFEGLPVVELEKIADSHPPETHSIFVAIGYSQMNESRKGLYDYCKKLGYSMPNYISPRCSFLTSMEIGDNNFILEDNTIQPFVKIGSNNVLWSGNHIGHDVEIGDHNFLTSHVVVSGFTVIKNNCFIGVNATLRDAITIANHTLIAAGAIIMKDTTDEEVILPAKSVTLDKKSLDLKI